MGPVFSAIAALALLCAASTATARETQTLSAKIDGAAFVSDDDSISLIPVPMGGTFTLIASTQGASSYPPPKKRIDRLSITCSIYTAGKPRKFVSKDFASSACRVSFQKGTKDFGKPSDAEYTLDKKSADNVFEIIASNGKLIEGQFHFQLKDAAGAKLMITEGHFKAEDRQL